MNANYKEIIKNSIIKFKLYAEIWVRQKMLLRRGGDIANKSVADGIVTVNGKAFPAILPNAIASIGADARRTRTMTIAIVDYGMGNLFSIYNALDYVGGSPKIINEPDELAGIEGIVVPGVGAFGQCMDRLTCFVSALNSARDCAIPIFAICIGLQVLFEESEESPAARGLGWVRGRVVKLPSSVMIPQMGWNSLSIKRPVEMLQGIEEGDMFYFVHSYYGQPDDKSLIVATTEHGVDVTAAIARDNLFATQFHPEKSGAKGLKILENFVRSIRC